MESLDTSDGRWLVFSLNTNQVHILIQFGFTLLDGTSDNASSTRDIDGLVNGHKEFLVDFTNWLLECAIHGLEQIFNGFSSKLALLTIQSVQS